MYALAVVLAATSNSKTTTSTGSAVGFYILLLVLFGGMYFFYLRPRSQAARRQRDTLMELGPGDEVLTGAGIFGTVLDVQADRVTIETAPGTRITVLRSTIARRITHSEDEPGGDDYPEYHEQYDEHGHEEHDGHDADEGAEAGGGDTHVANGSAHDEPHPGDEDEDGARGGEAK